MKKLLSPWMALATLVLLIIIRLADPSFVESIRLRYFDQLLTTEEPTVSKQVHVVNIDDGYIKQKGQFPFPRGEYSKIIDDLYSRHAGVVVFNIYMPDADRFGGDPQLAETLKKYNVVLPQTATSETYNDKYLPFRPGVSVIGGTAETTGIKYGNIEPNVKILNDNAWGVGVVNTIPELDGITRRVPMVINSKGLLYPSIGLETLRVASGDRSFQVKVSDAGIEAVRIPQFGKILTDPIGRIWIDPSIKPITHSATDLPMDFNRGIVIVGLTAKGLNNPVATANGAVYPHYIQASVLDTIMSGTSITRPEWANALEILLVAVLSVFIILLSRWKYAIVPIIAVVVSLFYASRYIFVHYGILLDGIFPIVSLSLVYGHAYTVKFVSELNQKMQIKKQFGSYVNPTIVERLQKDPSLIKLGGEKKVLSIVMTDLRGFTTLGESFGDDVEGLTQIMNDYMTALSIPVLANDGTLIKFIGDASLHVHGAPLDDPRHAFTAVKTAQQMIKAIEQFNVELTAKGKPPVGMGAGVNTGETLIGNIGAKSKFGYDVLGDSVSTAARLEGQTKSYGVLLIIGPNTNEIVKDEIFTLELDNIAVKGKTVGLKIYTPLHTDPLTMTDYIVAREKHDAMLAMYRAQQFDTAIDMSMSLFGEFNGQMDHSYELWIERCTDMKNVNLPKDWDGVFRATSK